jgi:hypothetical protein
LSLKNEKFFIPASKTAMKWNVYPRGWKLFERSIFFVSYQMSMFLLIQFEFWKMEKFLIPFLHNFSLLTLQLVFYHRKTIFSQSKLNLEKRKFLKLDAKFSIKWNFYPVPKIWKMTIILCKLSNFNVFINTADSR